MSKAFLFPGQGSQYVGMCKDIYFMSTKAKELYNIAEEILEYDLAKISFHGPEERLNQTKYTQPAIFLHSIILDNYLKSIGITPKAVAGHSLGEFSALVSAQILSFEDALQIIKVRSSSMTNAGKNNPGSMAAIIGADKNQLNQICNQEGIVVPANINTSDQIVISGEIKAINNAIITANSLGIKRTIKINVSGAFHSPLMKSARDTLKKVINSVNFMDAKIPIYQNVIGKPITNLKMIKENLINQLENPVLWLKTILEMECNGIDEFIEVGPGKVLKGLNKRINKELITKNFDKLENIHAYEIQ